MFGRSGITAAVKVEEEDDGKTPAAKRAGEYVTLKVQDTDGRAVHRTMRWTEQLQGLMDFYYDRAHGRVQRGTGRFLYDGRRLSGWQTPAELDMEDGDEVDFFEELIASRSAITMSKRSRSAMSSKATGEDDADDSSSPEVEASSLITLRVKDSEGVRITRTMRTTDALDDLMDFYLGMVPADMDAAEGVFMHYGRRVTGDRTPADYDMEDGDEVSFFPDGTWTTPVTLTVTDNNGRRVTHTMRRLHILDILFDLYFAMLPSTAPREGAFIYHCRELSPKQTPEECNMKDGDEIAFSPFSKPSAFVTLTIRGNNNNGGGSVVVTRTMLRTQERLQDLIDLYFAMVPTDDERGEFDVTYCGRKVDIEKTPADYGMEDGDQLRLAPATERSRFVTINLVTMVGVKRAYTLRRTDELHGLMDLCLSREPASMYQNGCIFLYNGLCSRLGNSG
uniref:Rad60/SUMO-like domain-containing protein n=1 Tax=Oryza nivara TaxID=4536 RepID=A0A0E0I2P0_ORYNI